MVPGHQVIYQHPAETKGKSTHTSEARHEKTCFLHMQKQKVKISCSTIPIFPNFKISCLKPSPVAVQLGLYRTWLETPKTGFVMMRLIIFSYFTDAASEGPKLSSCWQGRLARQGHLSLLSVLRILAHLSC